MNMQELKWRLAGIVIKEYSMIPVVESKLMRLKDALRDL